MLSVSQGPGSNSGLQNLRETIGPTRRTNAQLCLSHQYISTLLETPLASTQLLQFEMARDKSP